MEHGVPRSMMFMEINNCQHTPSSFLTPQAGLDSRDVLAMYGKCTSRDVINLPCCPLCM